MARADLHRADHRLEREQASVLPLPHCLVRAADGDVEVQPSLQVVVEGAAMRGRDQDVRLLAFELFLRVAEELHDSRVGRLDHAGLVDGGQPVGHVVQDRPHALLAFLQGDLGALALDELSNLRADVVHHGDEPVIQRARRPGVERDHAHDSPAAAHREADDAMQPRRHRRR